MLLSVEKQTYNEQHTLMKRSTPMQTRTKKAAPISFNDYKHITDEIIEISEQRFENILTRRLSEFKKSLMVEQDVRFNAIDTRINSLESKFESRFESIEKRLTFLIWFLPAFTGIILAFFKLIER